MKLKGKLSEIQAVENKYGLIMFRMGLTHLIDVGVSNLTDENVAGTIEQIRMKGSKDEADGKRPVMTPEFQCNILRCASELSKFEIWDLIAYIKKCVTVDNLNN